MIEIRLSYNNSRRWKSYVKVYAKSPLIHDQIEDGNIELNFGILPIEREDIPHYTDFRYSRDRINLTFLLDDSLDVGVEKVYYNNANWDLPTMKRYLYRALREYVNKHIDEDVKMISKIKKHEYSL